MASSTSRRGTKQGSFTGAAGAGAASQRWIPPVSRSIRTVSPSRRAKTPLAPTMQAMCISRQSTLAWEEYPPSSVITASARTQAPTMLGIRLLHRTMRPCAASGLVAFSSS